MSVSHNIDYYESVFKTAQQAEESGEWLLCDCPICHAEDCLATEAEYFAYNPVITTLEFEFGTEPTATANRIVVTSSLRGPPALS